MHKDSYVYIMTNKREGVLYTGVTSNLVKQVWEHKGNFIKGFTYKYNAHLLVYYEVHNDIMVAIKREKNIKAWNRSWKIKLITKNNPTWKDYMKRSFCDD